MPAYMVFLYPIYGLKKKNCTCFTYNFFKNQMKLFSKQEYFIFLNQDPTFHCLSWKRKNFPTFFSLVNLSQFKSLRPSGWIMKSWEKLSSQITVRAKLRGSMLGEYLFSKSLTCCFLKAALGETSIPITENKQVFSDWNL